MATRPLTWGVLGWAMTGAVRAQDAAVTCYGAGSMAMAVIFTFLGTLVLVGAVLYFLKRRADANRGKCIISICILYKLNSENTGRKKPVVNLCRWRFHFSLIST